MDGGCLFYLDGGGRREELCIGIQLVLYEHAIVRREYVQVSMCESVSVRTGAVCYD